MWIITFLAIVFWLGKLNRWRLERKWGSVDITKEVSARDKVVLVTGANAGIGKATAKEFACRDATVILACRDLSRAEEAVKWIRTKTSLGELVCMKLDLGSLQSIRQFAKEFQTKYEKLDILINNAGVVMPPEEKKKTSDGFEIHMGVNHLGPFLLTNLLLAKLKKGDHSRIVTLTSETHSWVPFDVNDIMSELERNNAKPKRPWANPLYCRSKMANALFNVELARRLEGTGVNCYALTPGVVASDLSQNLKGPMGWVNKTLRPAVGHYLLKTVDEGAATTMYCALNKDLMNKSGKMYMNCGDWDPNDDRAELKDSEARKLWDVSAKLVGLGNE